MDSYTCTRCNSSHDPTCGTCSALFKSTERGYADVAAGRVVPIEELDAELSKHALKALAK